MRAWRLDDNDDGDSLLLLLQFLGFLTKDEEWEEDT